MAEAYNATFKGGATSEQTSLVLVDLANFSGFYGVTQGEESVTLEKREGMRIVYARIFNFLHMSPDEEALLAVLAREERIVDQESSSEPAPAEGSNVPVRDQVDVDAQTRAMNS